MPWPRQGNQWVPDEVEHCNRRRPATCSATRLARRADKQITQQITTRGNATVALDKVGANARRMVDLSVLADCWRETVGFVWPAALPMFNRAWNTWLAVSAAIINARAEHVEAHAAAHLVSLDGMCVMAVHIDIHATVAALPIAQWACCNRCCRRIVAASSSALL